MKTKSFLFFSGFIALALAGSALAGGMRGGGSAGGGHTHFSSMSPGAGTPSMRGRVGAFDNRHFNGRNFRGDFRRHRRFEDVVFIDSFPFWGWDPWWGYPYGYYGYYPYGYYPYGYYGYGYGDYGYGDGYGHNDRFRVIELQRRLARAGYYHGSIDGIMGPQTRRALRAYQRDYGRRGYG